MLRILSSVECADGEASATGIPRTRSGRLSAATDTDMLSTDRMLTISAGGFDAHATCVVGQTQGPITYVTYVSLLGPGTTVIAIWANLMDHRTTVVTLEGVGAVQLWNRQPAFAELGYRVSWHRRHRVLQLDHGARVVHLVTEPDLLTVRDPLLADATTRSRNGSGGRSRGDANREEQGQHRGHGNAALTGPGGKDMQVARDTVPGNKPDMRNGSGAGAGAERSAAAMEQVNEQVAREAHPLFILLGRRGEDAHSLACRHLLFLAERVQWLAYYEPWADFFWRRGLRAGEIAPLSVWPALDSAHTPAQDSKPDEPHHLPADTRWIAAAYLCQPDPFALAAALPEAVRTQGLGSADCSSAAWGLERSPGIAPMPSMPLVPTSLYVDGGSGK